MIRIIEAEEKDIPAILKLEQAAFVPPWTEGALLCEIGRDEAYFALAVEESGEAAKQELIGFCILHKVSDEAELYQIAVTETSRRQGIAGKLMVAALDYAEKNGITAVFLEVRKSNMPALALYKKYGYQTVGRRKNYYDNPVEDAVIMERKMKVEQKQV